MKAINLNKEWEFIGSEMKSFSEKNVPYLIREVLFAARIMLHKYSDTKERKMKSFYKLIYLKSKKYYLERVH